MAAHPRPPVEFVPERQAVSLEEAKLHGNELINTPIGDIELVHIYSNDYRFAGEQFDPDLGL